MVQIGELAYKTRFDGRELTRGLLSTRQQMAAAKKLAEDTRTPLDRYRTGLDNLAAMSKRYSHVAERQIELSKQLEKQYLQEESAVRKLTKSERARLELLQLPDQIKARAATAPGDAAAARNAANRKAGLARQQFFQNIDSQAAAGQSSLQGRLAAFKQNKTARMADMGNSRVFASMGGGGIGPNFHSAGKQGDAPDASGGGLMFGVKAAIGGFAAAKVMQSVGAMREFAKESSRVYVSLEKTQAAFDVFTGSASKTQSIIAQMKQLSAISGVTFSTLSDGAATMMSYGLSTEDTSIKLKQLAEISRGDSERFKMMALAFGQVQAAGRLMGQETLQLINAGFNPLAEISRTTGRSMADLKKAMENGEISVQMVSDAFKSATSEGGRYNGMLAEIAKTTAGAQAKSSAMWEQAKADVGEALAPLTKYQAWLSEKLAKSVSDMANGMKQAKAAAPEEDPNKSKLSTFGRVDLSAIKKREEAAAAEKKRVQDAFQKEADRKKAMKESGLEKVHGLFNDTSLAGVDDKERKKFERATALMDDIAKEQATRDFAENKNLKMVYSYLDDEVRKELERVDAIEKQNELLDEQKSLAEKNKKAGEDMRERNLTAAERFKKQLEEIAQLQAGGNIDATTALRERMAIQDQMRQEMGKSIPQELLAGNATTARSISAGSGEFYKYLDELRALTEGTAAGKKNDPQVKELEDLNKKNDEQLAELRRQTAVQEKIASTSPKKIRG